MDFAVTDSDGYGLVEFLGYLVVDLLDSSWNDTSLLEVISKTKHSERLTSSSLSIGHYGSIVSSDNI
jgi:hypothetical protein